MTFLIFFSFSAEAPLSRTVQPRAWGQPLKDISVLPALGPFSALPASLKLALLAEAGSSCTTDLQP